MIEAAPRQCGECWHQSISRASRVFTATGCSCHEGLDRSSLCDTKTLKYGRSNTWQQVWEHTEGHYKLGETPNNLWYCCRGLRRRKTVQQMLSSTADTNRKRKKQLMDLSVYLFVCLFASRPIGGVDMVVGVGGCCAESQRSLRTSTLAQSK